MTTEIGALDAPKTTDDYYEWLTGYHNVPGQGKLEARYETVSTRALEQFQKAGFWMEVTESLTQLDAEYRPDANGYPLFVGEPNAPEVVLKPYASFLEKTFRRNVLENRGWPDPPASGWFVPDRCYERISDVVRTTFVVKYLDGVRFLCQRLSDIAGVHGLQVDVTYAASMEGHYAGHLDFCPVFRIPSMEWEIESVAVGVEIQVTTQLQELIRNLLHKHYEARRVGAVPDRPWQWDYESTEFAANYLGHILHYIEGMIVDVRQAPPTPTGEQEREVTKGDK